jgi:murein DD-endopeptidase MepM/ murein hydrolase activator NlpD
LIARGARLRPGLIALLLAAVVASAPVHADTAAQLSGARQRLSNLQGELNSLAVAYSAAEAKLAGTQAAIDLVRARIARVRATMARVNGQLTDRARQAYEDGGASTLQLLLSAGSFAEFSDRLQFLGQMQQADADLLSRAGVARASLGRDQRELARLSRQQAATLRALLAQRTAIGRALSQAQALVGRLKAQLVKEEAAAAHEATIAGGPIAACPVGQPRAFSDDFGDPRPGGRTHQGIDLLAPLGTPIYAAQPGTFRQDSNDLGGISALVDADSGDFTYYAHLSSYAGVGDGAHVSAGTMIGHVGNTGDAQGGPYHLHFEYHPGGGAAVDPYRMLVVACG